MFSSVESFFGTYIRSSASGRSLEKYEARDSCVTLQVGMTLDERILMQGADYYITTRSEGTVSRTCLAERYGTKVLYGTDWPLFPEDLR